MSTPRDTIKSQYCGTGGNQLYTYDGVFMCLIVFAWRPSAEMPMVLAANRDEFYHRTSLPLAQWIDHPSIYAGRDLRAGGTWLGVAKNRRFAALTNIRSPLLKHGGPSRGGLIATYLSGSLNASSFLTKLQQSSTAYAGFNLLLADEQSLWHYHSADNSMRLLEPGVYGLSNANLDTPWPKVIQAKNALERCLATPTLDGLFGLLQDRTQAPQAMLPKTGISLDWERRLSPIFINSPGYGTCASSVLMVHQNGYRQLVERRFDEKGAVSRETLIDLKP